MGLKVSAHSLDSVYVISSFWDSELVTSTEQTRISLMQQGCDRFVDNVKWWTQQCERVDVPSALAFLLLVWFPCELLLASNFCRRCYLWHWDMSVCSYLLCIDKMLRRGQCFHQEDGGVIWTLCMFTSHSFTCHCTEIFVSSSGMLSFFKVKSNCHTRLCIFIWAWPKCSQSNAASGEVWCDCLCVSSQCMKIQTWCEIDTSSPLARSWNEWFINWDITGACLNWFHISKHSIWIYYTLDIYIFFNVCRGLTGRERLSTVWQCVIFPLRVTTQSHPNLISKDYTFLLSGSLA